MRLKSVVSLVVVIVVATAVALLSSALFFLWSPRLVDAPDSSKGASSHPVQKHGDQPINAASTPSVATTPRDDDVAVIEAASEAAAQWAANIVAATARSSDGTSAGSTPHSVQYVTRMEELVQQHLALQASREFRAVPGGRARAVRFHVYDIPRKYIEGAIREMEARWATSYCNRHRVKTNYTMLDWRHAHSLFTVDVFMAQYLRFHPAHTDNPAEADIFIIPMMTHVYNCAGLMKYTIEILSWVVQLPYYRLYNNHDHYLFWWRWGMHFNSVQRFWKRVVHWIPNVNLISFDFLEITGRNDFQDFQLALKPKFLQTMLSVIVPYPDFSPPLRLKNLPATWEEESARNRQPQARDIFFYFTGTSTIGGIRRWIKRACENSTSDCVFQDFAGNVVDSKRLSVPSDYPSAMRKSVFCGHAAGDALSSRRPTSAVLAGCIPVLICDLCLYAWESSLDYAKFAVFVREEDVMNGRLWSILHSISPERVAAMQEELFRVRRHFVYNTDGPPQQHDALDMLVRELLQRGALLRSYRRWFTTNHHLSSNARDYPPIPPAVKYYLRRGSSLQESRDFNNLRG